MAVIVALRTYALGEPFLAMAMCNNQGDTVASGFQLAGGPAPIRFWRA